MRNSNLWTIMKKEFARFFGDKRMVMSVILLPGLMIYVMYTFMGTALADQFSAEEGYQYHGGAVNLPVSIAQSFSPDLLPIEFEEIDSAAADQSSGLWSTYSGQVRDMELDLLVVFPENFESLIMAYDPASGQSAPNVEVYFNSASAESSEAYSMFCGFLDTFEDMLANKFDINAGEDSYDLATDEDTSAQIFAMMLPMLLMTFMFSSCSAVAPESIAGEKERGTIATLLVTPMKRRDLAMGKICSLSVISLLGGFSSFLGTMLSIPKLMGDQMDNMSASVYGIREYALILLVILSTVLVIVSLISVISAYAKSIKEASTMITPLMIIVMLIGISGMFGGGAAQSLPLYLVPLYNSAQCFSGIFSFNYELPQIGLTLVSNLVCSGVLVVILTKMFSSERIMY